MPRERSDLSPIAILARDLDRAVADQITAAKATGAREAQLACRRGCAFCCYQLVPLTTLEAQGIADYISTRPRGERRDLTQTIDRQVKRFSAWVQEERPANIQDRATNLSYLRQGIPCPFLGKENECRVYPVRPLICRGHHALGSSEGCREAAGPIRVIPSVERATTAAMANARELAEALGLPTTGGLISTFAPLFRAALGGESRSQ